MDKKIRDEIINRILQEVHDQGSARVGFHAEKVIAARPIPYNIKSKIEGTITSSKKYISRPHPNFKNDFEILLNPNYHEEKENLEMLLLEEQVKDFPKVKRERNIAIVVGILSLILNVILIIVEAKKP